MDIKPFHLLSAEFFKRSWASNVAQSTEGLQRWITREAVKLQHPLRRHGAERLNGSIQQFGPTDWWSLYIEAFFAVAAQQTKARTRSDRRALQQQFGSWERPQAAHHFCFYNRLYFLFKSPSVLHLLECRLLSFPSLSRRPCPTLSSSLLQGIMCFWVCLVCSGGNFPWSVQMQREAGEQCGAVAARRGSKFLWRFKRGMLSATGGVPRSNHKSVYLVMVSQKDNSPDLCPITPNMITMMSSSLDCCAACRLNKLFPFTTKLANCLSRIPSRRFHQFWAQSS